MMSLIEDGALRKKLAIEATRRHFKTWQEYGIEVISKLADNHAFIPEQLTNRH